MQSTHIFYWLLLMHMKTIAFCMLILYLAPLLYFLIVCISFNVDPVEFSGISIRLITNYSSVPISKHETVVSCHFVLTNTLIQWQRVIEKVDIPFLFLILELPLFFSHWFSIKIEVVSL